MKADETSHFQSATAVLLVIFVAAYLVGYFMFRQSAAYGTIFLTSTGPPRAYRAINLRPLAAIWVHRIYWPIIVLDRKFTGTVVTVNIP